MKSLLLNMNEFKEHLKKILGREPGDLEMEAYAPFDPNQQDRNKLFSYFNPSLPLFLNIDDDHYIYISNHTNHLRCCLDMATRQLDVSSCYQHEHGTIMLGVAKPENEKHLNSRHINYHIYIQQVSAHSISKSLSIVSKYADHISLIRDESPWERLCRMCVETKTGGHITASSKRLFKKFEDGLLYIVPDHQHTRFNQASEALDSAPVFIGKTVPYPILSLDNEKGLLETPISTLRELQQEQLKTGPAKQLIEPDNEERDILSEIEESPDVVKGVFEWVRKERESYPSKIFSLSDEIQDLRIDALPLNGLSFSKNGIELHTLSSIVNLQIEGLEPIALSYYFESTAEIPQEIEPYLSTIKKSAKLFGIPIANNCVVPGNENRLKIFLISKLKDDAPAHTFQQSGDFICLLGDPNGTLIGSAYAFSHGTNDCYTPPGVMSGTLAALLDVINECHEKNIISSTIMISRGGLITALKNAMQGGYGASIYSERKGPSQLFIFGEPQAAAMVTIKEKHLIDLARITSNYNLTSTTIGRVTETPEIKINNEILISEKV